VEASRLGDFHTNYCQECLKQGAEPLWAIHHLIQMVGGPQNLAEWVKVLRSFRDGHYIEWQDILACYKPAR
jgi:hypothetical protein